MKHRTKRILSGLGLALLTAALVAYAAGLFRSGRVEPGRAPAPPALAEPGASARAELRDLQVFEEAVGTVRSRRTVEVAAQVTARVLAVRAEVGQAVSAGAPLVELDARELEARLAQARQSEAAADAARLGAVQARAEAEARLARAEAHFERVQGLLEKSAATAEEMEEADASFLQARAALAGADAAIASAGAQIEKARQVVAEASVALEHATIAAPIDGVVAERAVEPGDLAWPGRALLVVLDPDALRLEARVREGLVERVEVGRSVEVVLATQVRALRGIVSSIEPSADPASRTFEVRVDLDSVPGLRAGTFGRMRVPLGLRPAVLVPAEAVARVGQLETVVVQDGERWARRLVTTGAPAGGGMVEVLSGLDGGELVALGGERP